MERRPYEDADVYLQRKRIEMEYQSRIREERQPIETAPQDGTEVWVYVAEESAGWDDPLPAFECKAAYHPDAGWCVDELRQVTHWRPLRENE